MRRTPHGSHARRPGRRRPSRRPPLECLEDRRLLATFSVTSLADEVNDDGMTSLREAIALAASSPGGDLITFADGLSGAIGLSLGELVLDDRSGLVEIRAGAGVSTIDAGGASRVLSVRGGTTAALVGLTVSGGRTTESLGGGGILNAGSLTLDRVVVVGNQATSPGGGLSNPSGVLTMTGSTVSGNSAGQGGGILNRGTMTVTGSTISGNTATSPNSAIGGGGLSNSGVLTLVGTTVSGNSASAGAGLASSGLLELRGSAVRDNAAGRGGGGIIARYGTMALIDSTVSGNSAGRGGGGLYNYGGQITLTRSTVSGNSARQGGGGLDNYYGGTITLDGSTISGNSAATGGGLTCRGGRVTLTGSTVSGNVASGAGGGFAVQYGTIRVVDSTLSGNRAESGGGLAHFGGDVELLNSTVSMNSATGDGGGLLNWRTLRLTHATLTGNRADGDGDGDGSGGGVFSEGPSLTQLVNSIISGNRRGTAETPDDLGGLPPAPGSAGNLVGSGAEGLDPTVNLVGVDDPRLGPLADNGGPTRTHAPLPDSPAVDEAYILPGVTTDQRGRPRHLGGLPDVGAFEREGPPPGEREPGGLVVTTLDDIFNPFDFRTTLREAIAFASSRPGDGAITFDPALAGSISVLSALYGELTLADGSGAVAIDGRGAITLDARGSGRVFRVGQGTTATLSGLTITGGRATGFGGGGGVQNSGRLTVVDSTVAGNSAGSGGGLSNDRFGTLTVLRSSIIGNEAGSGGGIDNNNQAFFGDSGGGVVTLIDSTVSGNSASGTGGGLSDYTGRWTLINTTVSGNTAGSRGGGIWGAGSNLGAGRGLRLSEFTLIHTTITDNRALGEFDDVAGLAAGGGIAFDAFGGSTRISLGGALSLSNSIVAGNRREEGGAGPVPDDIDPLGTVPTGAGNVVGTGGGGMDARANFLGVLDPRLGPLADNGGPTRTHAPLPDSPAVNTGVDALSVGLGGSPLADDQRGPGFPRRVGPAVDAGAVESGSPADRPVPEARSLVVTTLDDLADRFDGRTSLREALSYAAELPGAQAVTFVGGLSGVVALRGTLILGGDPGPIAIDGRDLIGLDAGGAGRAVRVLDGTTATIVGLTITGGRLASFGGGGGVFNAGELTLVGSTVSGNAASFGGGLLNYGRLSLISSTISGNVASDPDGSFDGNGGGISNYGGELTLVDSVVSGNRAGFGAGIHGTRGFAGGPREFDASLRLVRTAVRANEASRSGGGLANGEAPATIVDSTISGNSAGEGGGGISGSNLLIRGSTIEGNTSGRDGGGLNVGDGTTLVDSTVAGNAAGRDGGGLAAFGGTVTLVNSTVSGNTAMRHGGGIVNAASLVLTHATLTANRAGSGGGGGLYTAPPYASYYYTRPGGSSRLVNTIVSGNTRGEGRTPDNLGGVAPAPASAGNLVGSGAVSVDPALNFVGVDDPRLGPLADNGGPTRTHALLPDSLAIDAGIYLTGPATDQRGLSRLQGITPDTGSFETEAAPPRDPEVRSLIVSTLDDLVDPYDDRTSLREALAFAASRPGDDAITFAPSLSGTIAVQPSAYGDLTLADGSGSVTIDGRGAITLDARGAGRVLRIEAGTTATLVGLTITGGRLEARGEQGGGILNSGDLTLADSVVRDNTGADGGGVYNRGGSLTLVRGVVSGNVALYNGGGISSYEGDLTVIDSIIRDNAAGGINPEGFSGSGGGLLSVLGTLTITGSTITGNSARPGRFGGGEGGGLLSSGVATLTASTVSGNAAGGDGGGITASDTMTIRGTTVSGNTAGNYGGGIRSFGSLTVDGSTIRGNSTGTYGGGIQAFGTLAVANSTIVGNASGRDGGGVSLGVGGRMTIEGSLVRGNTAARDGGGLANFGTLTLTASTLAGNSAGRDGGGLVNTPYASEAALRNATISGNSAGRDGGGVANARGLTLLHATLTENRADADGDGFGSGGGLRNAGTATLLNSIVSGNRRSPSGAADNLAGAAPEASSRGNLVGSGEVSLDPEANLVDVDDPGLGPLAFNGGPTPTHALLPGSPALDAALEALAAGADQRGVARPQGLRPDIGAFELKRLDVIGFSVQGGQRQRSFVRTIEIRFAGGLGLLRGLVARGGLRLVRYAPDGSGPGVAVPLDGALSILGDRIVLDFGPQGIGGDRNSSAGDGSYVLEVDTDGDGTFEARRSFYRLLGDVDGDRRVDPEDLGSILDGIRRPYDPERDVNGDGVVNALDRVLAARNLGASIADDLDLDD